jgi:hypothetical protein
MDILASSFDTTSSAYTTIRAGPSLGVNYDVGATVVTHQAAGLSGTIPTEIGFLTNLVRINLSDNHLTGSLPMEIGYLTLLTSWNLSFNDATLDFGFDGEAGLGGTT